MSRVIHIRDAADPRIAAYVSVRERDIVGHGQKFIAEGELVLRMLLAQSRFSIESVFVLDRRLPRLAPLLAGLPDAVPVYSASRPVMDRAVGFPIHRGSWPLASAVPSLRTGSFCPGWPKVLSSV
jgi:tRNA G18 (ribose-2'-O)-methylase SpoU